MNTLRQHKQILLSSRITEARIIANNAKIACIRSSIQHLNALIKHYQHDMTQQDNLQFCFKMLDEKYERLNTLIVQTNNYSLRLAPHKHVIPIAA